MSTSWRFAKPLDSFVVEVHWHATKKRLVVNARNASKALISAAHKCRGGVLHPVEYVVEDMLGVVQMRATPEEVDVLKGKHDKALHEAARPLVYNKYAGDMGGVRA